MKVFFDTNVLISAYYFKGNERRLMLKVIESDHVPVISTQVIHEVQTVMQEKFKESVFDIEDFIERLLADMVLVRDYKIEIEIADESDKNILGSAVKSSCKYLVTGDKLILRCDVEHIRVLNAKDMLGELESF